MAQISMEISKGPPPLYITNYVTYLFTKLALINLQYIDQIFRSADRASDCASNQVAT